MDKPGADILQIRKYLNGELDAKAMHQLERRAQDDPFLMDALEGYGIAGNDQRQNIALLADRLRNRTTKKERRMIPWTMVSIAAGIVGFMIVVGLLYKADNNQIVSPQVTHAVPPVKVRPDTVKPVPATAPTINRSNVLAGNSPVHHLPATSKMAARSVDSSPSEIPAVAELAAPPVADTRVKPDTASPMADMVMGVIARQKDSAEMPLTVAVTKRPVLQTLPSKAAGVTTTKSENNINKLNTLNLPPGAAGYLAGVVTNTNGLPMPGATVKVVGKSDVTQTDAKGGFALPASKDKETLDVSYRGYESKKIRATRNDSLLVELNANYTSANGLVTTTGKPLIYKTVIHPVGGWETFYAYVKKNAVLPAGSKPGSVTTKFTVWPDGSVSNISVVESLSPVADVLAVSIIRHSGKWAGITGGKPETITKIIDFTAAN